MESLKHKFYMAVEEADIEELEFILKRLCFDFDVGQILPDGITALQAAIEHENARMAELLVRHGADPRYRDEDGDTYLHLAVESGNLQMVRFFSEYVSWRDKNRDGYNPFEVCLVKGDKAIFDYLVERATAGDSELQRAFADEKLHAAVEAKSLKDVEDLLRLGADPNHLRFNGVTALHSSFQHFSSCEVLDLFLEYGADVHLKDCYGFNALHHAALMSESCQVIEKLLQIGMNPNERTHDGLTCLHLLLDIPASSSNSTELLLQKVLLLVGYGADINAPLVDCDLSCLFMSVRRGEVRLTKHLLDLGADVDGRGMYVPIIQAMARNDYDSFRLLLDRGARIDFNEKTNSRTFHEIMQQFTTSEFRRKIVRLMVQERSRLMSVMDLRYSKRGLFAC